MSDAQPARLAWWQYVGPWPIRPWVAFWGVGAVNLIAGFSANREVVLAHPVTAVLTAAVPTALGSAAFAGVLFAASRACGRRTPAHLVSYLLVVLLGAIAFAVVRFAVVRAMGVASVEEAAYLPLQILRSWLWAVFLLALAGETVRRLRYQGDLAEQALAVSLEQQELLLVNDERSRRQVAALLHDRVQAGLMTACLELRMSMQGGAAPSATEIERIIARIDDIRGLDVRQAARTLSPDLANVDLRTAMTELARSYEPGMSTEVVIDPRISSGELMIAPDVQLACYRIVEQGLLNAVAHGAATRCAVSMEVLAPHGIGLNIVDNGKGESAKRGVPGFGSAVIDAWCRVLGGGWDLALGTEGARLGAQLPNTAASTSVRDETLSGFIE